MSLYINLIQNIVKFSNLETQIKLCSLCQENNYFLKIFKLNASYDTNITQEIIEQDKFNKLRELDTNNNKKIYNINFLKFTLEILDASGKNCAITQEGIEQLIKLKNLNASYNSKIYDLTFAKNTLKYLYISFCPKITYENINQLTKLICLYTPDDICSNIDFTKFTLKNFRFFSNFRDSFILDTSNYSNIILNKIK